MQVASISNNSFGTLTYNPKARKVIMGLIRKDMLSNNRSIIEHINWNYGANQVNRLEILENRTQNTMKKLIERLVPKGNRIVTDNAACYNFLNRFDSGYNHSIHTHGHGDFGEGLDSTSHIEQLWQHLKQLIKEVYKIIPMNNFVLFLHEAEWRRNYCKFESNKFLKFLHFKMLLNMFIQ